MWRYITSEDHLNIADSMLAWFYNLFDTLTLFKVQLIGIGAKVPVKADYGCAGYDVFSTVSLLIEPGKRVLVPTGIKTQIPRHYYLRVAPRSGLAVRGIDIAAGVVDSSYRGEIKVLVVNNSETSFVIEPGIKIAQLILERCSNTKVHVSDLLSETERGYSGFGSTGS